MADDPELISEALTYVMRRKALGSEALATQRDAILGGKYTHLRSDLQLLSELRMQIAKESLALSTRKNQDKSTERIASWAQQKEHLEGLEDILISSSIGYPMMLILNLIYHLYL